MKKNRLIIFMAIIISLAAFVGCSKDNKDVVAKVNGQAITKDDLDQYVTFQKKVAEANGQISPDMWDNNYGDGRTFDEVIKEIALEELIMQDVLKQMAKEHNVEASDKEIEEEFKKQISTDEQKANFKKYLENMKITEKFFKQVLIKRGIIANKYVDEVIKVDDKKAKEYYEQRKALFDQVRASHILVKTEEEAKAIKKQLDEGAKFEELAKEKSLCPSKENGGDLGFKTYNGWVKEFSQKAFELEVGQISEPVKTNYGYHIIKVTDKKFGFEKNKDQVIRAMKQEEYQKQMQEFRSKAKVEILIELAKPKSEEKDKKQEGDKTQGEDKKQDNKEEKDSSQNKDKQTNNNNDKKE
ncbi:peptidylprolyl isomerase [Clostridiaceae bacterium M8S5]|nr:peptidylprolyl isomerase [Clostridiaceae bacterium M8S5]